jgi:hypothetical protein
MSQELRQALKEASNIKNRVDPRRVSLYVPGSSSQEPDVSMSDLAPVGSLNRNVEQTPSTRRKKTSRERREKSDDEDSLSESESESGSISEEDQLRGSHKTGPANDADNIPHINVINNGQQAPIQQPVQHGQIQPQHQPLIDEEHMVPGQDQQEPPAPLLGNNGGGGGNQQPGGNLDVGDLLHRLLTAINAPANNRQQRRARERKKTKDDGRVPAELPEFSGKEGTITLEEWVARLSQTAELRDWSSKQTLYAMLCKLKPPASDYVYGLEESRRKTVKALVYELTMLYGETRLSKQDHYRELLRAPQLPVEKASDYLNRTLVHYRHLTDMDRLSLLELLISPEYSEQLRLANVQQFDQALPVLLAYEKTLKNSSALTRVNQPIATSVNAIQNSYNSPNDVSEIIRKNRQDLEALRDRFETFESLIHELKKVVKKNNNYSKPQQTGQWCNYHKSSSHSDADCRKQQENSNQSKGSRNHGSNGRNRPNGWSKNGRNDASSQDKSKN